MQHARALLESRPYLTRVPDQGLVKSDAAPGPRHPRATRAADGSYALVYCPTADPVTVDLAKLAGPIRATWFDPRTGKTQPAGEFKNQGTREFKPPGTEAEKDWVLVLDEASKDYPLDFKAGTR